MHSRLHGAACSAPPDRFDDRSTARKWAVRHGIGCTDRLVLACEECPAPKRLKPRPPRLSVLAHDVTVADAPVAEVRKALKASIAPRARGSVPRAERAAAGGRRARPGRRPAAAGGCRRSGSRGW